MIKRLFALITLAACLGSACASLSPQTGAALRVECNVPEAALLLDDVPMGRASEWAAPDRLIQAGFYRVELRHPAYHSYMTEITVKDGGSARVEAKLHPRLD